MSDDGHGSSGEQADHHHEAFDAEPATELSPGEPESPLWLPVVGVALFVGAGIWWSMGEEEPSKSPEGAASAVAAAGAPAPAAEGARANPTPRPAARPGARPPARPGATGAPGPGRVEANKLSPEAVEKLRKRLLEARQKGAQ